MTADPAERGGTTEPIRLTVEAVLGSVRRHNRNDHPLGPKAIRTRASLLAAARTVFAEKGYVATTTYDITEEAGTSLATFYQYFADLNSVVVVLAGQQAVEMLENRVDDWDPATGRLGLRRLVAVFVRGYFDNVDFYQLWEQVSIIEPSVRRMRREFWSAYKRRIEISLIRGVDSGVVRSRQDPARLARALLHMMDRYCYDVTIGDPPDQVPDVEDVIDFITSLWVDALALDDGRPSSPGPGPDTTASTERKIEKGSTR